jgi:hypothetical protein
VIEAFIALRQETANAFRVGIKRCLCLVHHDREAHRACPLSAYGEHPGKAEVRIWMFGVQSSTDDFRTKQTSRMASAQIPSYLT